MTGRFGVGWSPIAAVALLLILAGAGAGVIAARRGRQPR